VAPCSGSHLRRGARPRTAAVIGRRTQSVRRGGIRSTLCRRGGAGEGTGEGAGTAYRCCVVQSGQFRARCPRVGRWRLSPCPRRAGRSIPVVGGSGVGRAFRGAIDARFARIRCYIAVNVRFRFSELRGRAGAGSRAGTAAASGAAISRHAQRRAAPGRRGAGRTGAGAGGRGDRQDARPDHASCASPLYAARVPEPDARRHLHQQGRAGNARASRKDDRRLERRHVARHVPFLRRHAEVVGLKQNFTILDTDDQLRLAKQILQAAGFDDKAVPARSLLGAIERWKDRGLTPDKVGAKDRPDLANGKAPDLYRAYQERLLEVNAADFGDLLLHNLTIFNTREDILADYQRRFRYILVDEYQDTNVSQYLWLRLLAQQHKNLCCVGDDDQSIYSWRGAEIGNILRFEKDFPGAKIVRREQNYRSTPPILAAASGLIAKNAGRLGKTLWTSSAGGDKVVLKPLWNGIEEARWVGDEIEALQRKGQALSQIAILVRTGFQTREFEE